MEINPNQASLLGLLAELTVYNIKNNILLRLKGHVKQIGLGICGHQVDTIYEELAEYYLNWARKKK